jgi:uncharacterized protein
MQKLLKILKWTAIGYIVLMLSGYFFQEKMVFWQKSLPQNYQYVFKVPFKELWFEPEKNVRINALYFNTDSTKRKGIVLYFHGNADNLQRWGKHAPDFTRNGYDVLMIDYRVFGKSVGKPSEAALHADARFVYNYARKLFPENQIIVYGRSLGTGIATKLASENNPKMLLLETPYISLPDVSWSHLPIFPYEKMADYTMHTDQWIAKVKCPIHFFHGTEDELVPYNSSIRLAAILHQNPTIILTTIEGGKHKNLSDFKAYHLALDSCLTR